MRRERWGGLDVVITGGTDREGGGSGPVVVLLHGFGAPGDDLVSLWRMLEVPAEVRFVFPAAPLALGHEFAGGRAWWPIDVDALQRDLAAGRTRSRADEMPEGLDHARSLATVLLDDVERELAVPAERIVLGGFSQGAMLSCELAFRTQRALAGLVLLSGTLVAARAWRPGMPARRGLRVFQSHGRMDPLLPYEMAEVLRDELTGAGMDVSFQPFMGGHEIPFGVLTRLARWLTETTSAR
ncbi:MAG: alpha/beta fold hydrolase [Deltaproteobacteria bacterium]|nr:alpha/beta fold hydrolase [Deltaproteobacteria bacterium]